MSKGLLLAGVLFASLALAPPAYAEATAEERAAADALYEDAGKLMREKRWAEACRKLETSQRLDPGIGTSLRLGYCYANEGPGRTASSWSAFNDAEAMARRASDKRADEAAKQAKLIEPRLSRLLILPASPAPGLEVRRDGKPVDAGLWGTAVPVDPGEHVVEASAPGKQTWKGSVRIDAAPGTTTVAIPELPAGIEPPKDAPAPPYWNGQRISGVAIGGGGLVGVAVGSAFTAVMRNTNTASLAFCPTSATLCYAQGVNLRNQALDASYVATGTFVAGTVLAATGLVMFFTARTASPPVGLVPVSGRHVAGLALAGGW